MRPKFLRVVAISASLLAASLVPTQSMGASSIVVSADEVVTTGSCGGTYGCTPAATYELTPVVAGGYLTYDLTPGAATNSVKDAWDRAGGVFLSQRIDFRQPFDFKAELNFDDSSIKEGADGIAFVIQTASSSSLFGGGGLGYGGMKPVVAVEFDTQPNTVVGGVLQGGINWQDLNDLTLDYWGLLARAHDNASTDSASHHGTYGVAADGSGSANQYSLGNIEDGNWKPVRFVWDGTKLTGYVDANSDGDFLDTNETQTWTIDIIDFLDSDFGYIGITGSVGGAATKNQVRFDQAASISFTARTNTAPTIAAQADAVVAPGAPAQTIDLVLTDDSTLQGQWSATVTSSNTGVATVTQTITSDTNSRLTVTPVAPGTTTITLTVTDADGLTATRSFSFTVGVTKTVTFDANGGAGSMSSQSSTTATTLSPNTFARDGFVFTGWNTAADGSGTDYADGANFAFGTDVTLFAQWGPPPPPTPYSGPIPTSMTTIRADGVSLATVTGERLNQVSSVAVSGRPVKITPISDTAIGLEFPALPAGTYDIIYTSLGGGTITHQGGLRVLPVEADIVAQIKSFSVAKRFTTYRGDRGPVVARDAAAITAFIRANPGLTQVTCVGSTSGQPAARTDRALALARAKNACTLVEQLVPGVQTKLAASTGRGVGQFFRAVTLFGKGERAN